MSNTLDTVKALIGQLNERDDALVAMFAGLKAQIDTLQQQLADPAATDADLQAIADQLTESVAKFDQILAPAIVPEPLPEPTPEPVVEDPAPVEPVVTPEPVVDAPVEPGPGDVTTPVEQPPQG